ncbi:ribosome maturation factor RimM [Miltoncostaea marina]|uniref:ribosome maturation factor RimM n=1 Tax=Miltoncostaea marina TaxID=2843215 RepID=UPI001C3DA31E|nr:ribosome maturation factor RimM [Miltoncostaea marina]
MTASRVVIGTIGRPHGVRGGVRARASGPTLGTLERGEVVEARPRDGAPRLLTVAERGGMADAPVLRFDEVGDREAAAALTGAEIAVEPGRIAELGDPDTFFVRDLVGCEVLLGDRPLGPVSDVIAAPANDALEVATADGPVLVPFTADAVRDLDLPGRRIVVRPDLLG